jgi:hypothetical protein
MTASGDLAGCDLVVVLSVVQEPADRAFATPPYTRVGD